LYGTSNDDRFVETCWFYKISQADSRWWQKELNFFFPRCFFKLKLEVGVLKFVGKVAALELIL
jgi:hypothetical protein